MQPVSYKNEAGFFLFRRFLHGGKILPKSTAIFTEINGHYKLLLRKNSLILEIILTTGKVFHILNRSFNAKINGFPPNKSTFSTWFSTEKFR